MTTENDKQREIDEFGYVVRPNKTILKQENLELQAFILQLSQLSKEVRAELPIDADALHQLGKIAAMPPSTARKRELRFATKYFSEWTPEVIEEYHNQLKLVAKRQIGQDNHVEKWRDRLLEESTALTEFVAAHPETNVQQLRQLVRNAKKESAAGKAGAAANNLFKAIRESVNA